MWRNTEMTKPKCKNTGTTNVESKNEMSTNHPPNPKSTMCGKKINLQKK